MDWPGVLIVTVIVLFLGIILGGVIEHHLTPRWEDKPAGIVIYENVRYRLVPVEKKWHDKE